MVSAATSAFSKQVPDPNAVTVVELVKTQGPLTTEVTRRPVPDPPEIVAVAVSFTLIEVRDAVNTTGVCNARSTLKLCSKTAGS